MLRDLAFPAVFLAFSMVLLAGTSLSHDVSWYLISTRWWLDGTPIYQDILELNPPLAFYLTVPPVWLAGLLDISATTLYQLYVLALASVSLVLTAQVLRGVAAIPDWMRMGFLAGAAVAIAVVPLPDFGQREHLFSLFLLPYLALVLAGFDRPWAQRAGIAVWATLGIALKHYFVLIPLALLIHRMIAERSFRVALRVEYVLPAILLIVYVPVSYLLHPAYFKEVIPLTLQVYGAYHAEFSEVVLKLGRLAVIIGAATVLMLLNRGGSRAATALLIVALMAVAIYLVQSKGWRYHRVPIAVCGSLALCWITMELMRARDHLWPLIPASLAAAVILIPVLQHGPYRNNSYYHVAQYFTCPVGERTVQVLSARVSDSFPMANYAGAMPSNRAPALWLFPGAASMLETQEGAADRAPYEATLHLARDLALDDFFRTAPQLMVVNTRKDMKHFGGADFDFIDYFLEDARFAQAWADYTYVGTVDDLEIFRRNGCDTPHGGGAANHLAASTPLSQ
jgi:hypothetical protein